MFSGSSGIGAGGFKASTPVPAFGAAKAPVAASASSSQVPASKTAPPAPVAAAPSAPVSSASAPATAVAIPMAPFEIPVTSAQIFVETIAAGAQLTAQVDRAIVEDQVIGMRNEASVQLARHMDELEKRVATFDKDARMTIKRYPTPANQNQAVQRLWSSHEKDFIAAVADLQARVERVETRREELAKKQAERDAELGDLSDVQPGSSGTGRSSDSPIPKGPSGREATLALPLPTR